MESDLSTINSSRREDSKSNEEIIFGNAFQEDVKDTDTNELAKVTEERDMLLERVKVLEKLNPDHHEVQSLALDYEKKLNDKDTIIDEKDVNLDKKEIVINYLTDKIKEKDEEIKKLNQQLNGIKTEFDNFKEDMKEEREQQQKEREQQQKESEQQQKVNEEQKKLNNQQKTEIKDLNSKFDLLIQHLQSQPDSQNAGSPLSSFKNNKIIDSKPNDKKT